MKSIYLLFLFFSIFLYAQEKTETTALDVQYFSGNVMAHTDDLQHFLQGHPNGIYLNLYQKTYGHQEWQSAFNYPDYGGYFIYQDFKNDILGEVYGVGALYNFYFLNRNLKFNIAQGIAYTTSPHDKVTNNKNAAFGSRLVANTNFALNYTTKLFDKFDLKAGFLFTHFSNGRIKAPNSGVNSYALSMGVTYNFQENLERKMDTLTKEKVTEPIRYNFVLRTGVSESSIIGSGQKPFYHPAFYLDKRISRKSAFQLGTEVFFTQSYKEYIKFMAIAYPNEEVELDTDYRRIGVFVGYELYINRISLEAQLGYYVYQPYKSDIPVYDRLGMKYYITKNIYSGLSIKTHVFLAEAMEFLIGFRL